MVCMSPSNSLSVRLLIWTDRISFTVVFLRCIIKGNYRVELDVTIYRL